MTGVAIFSPNSINILAGINGIEVLQSIIVALLLVFNDCLYLFTPYPHPATDSHLFSLFFIRAMFLQSNAEDAVLKAHFQDEWVRWSQKTPYRMFPLLY